MKLISFISAFVKNKFLLTLTAFVVWMLFIDHNDFFLQLERRRELKDLESTLHYYEQQVASTQKELGELQNNTASIEKLAREKYLMKKDNEDLFIVNEEKTK